MSKKKGLLSELFGSNKSKNCCHMESIKATNTEVKERKTSKCGCSCGCKIESTEKVVEEYKTKDSLCCIKVLGSGCKNCHILLENTQEALKTMGIKIEVEYVTDIQEITKYGVMSMPALVVNEKVVSMGKVLKVIEVENLLCKLGF